MTVVKRNLSAIPGRFEGVWTRLGAGAIIKIPYGMCSVRKGEI